MKRCGKRLKVARNGSSRGFCTKPFKHGRFCGNGTCSDCGVVLAKQNASPATLQYGSGTCSKCNTKIVLARNRANGQEPRKWQEAGKPYRFSRCGCEGTLPKRRGESSQFAIWQFDGWICRASRILVGNQAEAKEQGYKPIDINTPHAIIRNLMRVEKCVLCGALLKWELGPGKTPHLHHDHDSGEMLGFAHSRCNPFGLKMENLRLRRQLARLKKAA
jgi:hypothetical protein